MQTDLLIDCDEELQRLEDEARSLRHTIDRATKEIVSSARRLADVQAKREALAVRKAAATPST